jgi:hypothetical protein
MLNTICTCSPMQDGKKKAKSSLCLTCDTKHSLESWTAFLEDFRCKNPSANHVDRTLMERLNLKWLREGKPESWSEVTSIECATYEHTGV